MEKAIEKRKEITLKRWYVVVNVLLIALSLVFSFFYFQPVFERVVQSIVDLALSLAYYVTQLLRIGNVRPTVNKIPGNMYLLLPTEWSEFFPLLKRYGELLISPANFKAWLAEVALFFVDLSEVICLVLPTVLMLVFLLSRIYTRVNNDYSHVTKPLRLFKKIESVVYYPTKRFVVEYLAYVKERRFMRWILLAIWAYNLNLLTIVVEILAYYLYFCINFFEIKSIYTQFVKLVCDLSVPLNFLPWWAQAIIGYKIFDYIRQKLGMAALQFYEEHNRTFLKLYLGALFLVGKQRSKKTTIITDMAMTQEVIFREDAKELLSTRDKQFPHFPWQDLELFYRISLSAHTFPTLAKWRQFIGKLRDLFEKERSGEYSKAMAKSIRRNFLKRKYGYVWSDFIFGYDYKRYGLTYNDNLTVINVFEAIEGYVQMFYIYAAPTTLLFGNYPIRTDKFLVESGNFPELYANFFDRNPEDAAEESHYNHIPNLDNFRLGEVYDATDPYINSFEIGVLNGDEWAKERGNQNTNVGLKTTDKGVNPKNDRYEENLKMIGHKATIENYTWFRLLLTDQRPDSLSAENKDLCDIIMIRGVSDPNIVMPGFLFDEALYALATKIHDAIYYKLRHVRGDANNTLLVYLMKKLYTPIFRHYDRLSKKYTVYTASLKIWDAMTQEKLKNKGKYYISMKKTYSGRFATDGIKKFYDAKTLTSEYGLNDVETYDGQHMTIPQMKKVQSIFYNRMIDTFMKQELTRQQKKEEKTKAKKEGTSKRAS